MTRARLSNAWCAIIALAAVVPVGGTAFADRFGDITVQPMTHGSGETHHGYREILFFLQNHSTRRTHEVTLVFPDRAYSWGNTGIGRISRKISLSPGSRMVVPIWHPPLPLNGNGLVRVMIAGEGVETVSVPSATHVGSSGPRYSGMSTPATVLVSRGVDYDGLGRVLRSGSSPMAAKAATGAPDSATGRGLSATAWTPDTSVSGPHWIELEYDPPIQADAVRIRGTTPMGGFPVRLMLTGVSGTNLLDVTSSVPTRGSPYERELVFPRTPEPVKMVRIDFGMRYAGSIAVDAVELRDSGSGTTAWATDARASSEASAWSIGGPGAAEMRTLLRSELPVSEWSEHWLSYSAYDAIAVSAAELRGVRPAVLNALWHYAECGGVLFVLGPGETPASWARFEGETYPDGRALNAGFGKCFLAEAEQPGRMGAELARAMMAAVDEAARFWRSLPDDSSANAVFPVVDNARIPVRGIVFIMLVFVVVIGPVNLILLSRTGRRTWLLWTIPAISLFTSFVVFLYSMLREGITPDVRVDTLTFLDQSTRRAASIGAIAVYCPLTPSEGLFFSSETEATPLLEWNHGSGTLREVDWSRGQHLQRGWVTARVPAHFWLRKAESRRERIQLESEGSQLMAVNGLGAPIQSLWLADHEGRIYAAENVAAGQKIALRPTGTSVSPRKGGGRVGALEYSPFEQGKTNDIAASLAPASYVAELNGNPFVEHGLGERRSMRLRTRALVYGLLEPRSNQP